LGIKLNNKVVASGEELPTPRQFEETNEIQKGIIARDVLKHDGAI